MNETARSVSHALTVDKRLRAFVEDELLPDLGVDPGLFWDGFAAIVSDLTPENRALLETRDELQATIDQYHKDQRGNPWDADAYKAFLKRIGYLEESGEAFHIETENVHPEIATVARPQLVVPVSNARFALNAANARWGSLYDAFYGTDVIPESDGREPGQGYNPVRGASVIQSAAEFLDTAVPLAEGRHADVVGYDIYKARDAATLSITLADGHTTVLRDAGQFIGFAEEGKKKTLLLKNNGLHIEICIDPDHPIGKDSPADVSDIILEAAVTTIQDCEDSVAAVDAEDKVNVYRNWLGLMRGTLSATFAKGGREMTRRLNEDRQYTAANGGTVTLPGRSLMLVRNVGHLMTNPAVLDADGAEVFEGIMDAVMTTACALYDL